MREEGVGVYPKLLGKHGQIKTATLKKLKSNLFFFLILQQFGIGYA